MARLFAAWMPEVCITFRSGDKIIEVFVVETRDHLEGFTSPRLRGEVKVVTPSRPFS